jgi:glutathionyl-hydroquinone reductase
LWDTETGRIVSNTVDEVNGSVYPNINDGV